MSSSPLTSTRSPLTSTRLRLLTGALLLALQACGPEVVTYQPPDMSSKDMPVDAKIPDDMAPEQDATMPPEDMSDLADTPTDLAPDVDMAPDLGPCGQACADPTPVCQPDTGTCVACLQDTDCADGVCDTSTNTCVACLQDMDCEGDQRCEPASQTCVSCLEAADCTQPSASSCGADFSCGACQNDNDCAHLTDVNTCDAGTCVQCTPGTEVERCGPNSCDPVSFTCTSTRRDSKLRCESCRADSECDSGSCVVYQPVGSSLPATPYCLPEAVAGECEGFFALPSRSTSLSGKDDVYCKPGNRFGSCEAVRDMLDEKSCPEADLNAYSSSCGQPDKGDDGVCVKRFGTRSDSLCSLPCFNNSACPDGETCVNLGFSSSISGKGHCGTVTP